MCIAHYRGLLVFMLQRLIVAKKYRLVQSVSGPKKGGDQMSFKIGFILILLKKSYLLLNYENVSNFRFIAYYRNYGHSFFMLSSIQN